MQPQTENKKQKREEKQVQHKNRTNTKQDPREKEPKEHHITSLNTEKMKQIKQNQ